MNCRTGKCPDISRDPSVPSLFDGFVEYLSREEQAARISVLQLTGSMEEYLVWEFITFVHGTTQGGTVTLKEAAGRSDVALLRGQLKAEARSTDDLRIVGIVEAKYTTNHAYLAERGKGQGDDDKNDGDKLEKLWEKVVKRSQKPTGALGGYEIDRDCPVYALVFAGYTRRESPVPAFKERSCGERDEKLLGAARSRFVQHHGAPIDAEHGLVSVWENRKVESAGAVFALTLKAGLWRPQH